MKKIVYIVPFVLLLIFSGCSEDFLDRKNLYEQLDENFYSNPEEIGQALTAAYSKLTSDWGAMNYSLVLSIMGDDRLSGGAINDVEIQGIDEFNSYVEDTYVQPWETCYEGIFRCNMIISRFDQAEYDDPVAKNRDLGEAYFLRGYFYLRLARMFGAVPLITSPAPVNNPRAAIDDLYAQIASDLKKAIELMPSTPVSQIPIERDGHATKWAAQGIMARAFLFYTGYYNKTEMPLAEGGSVTQTQVLEWLEDCIDNSGHALLPDFRSLWTYSATASDYAYAANHNLTFAGEGNIEVMFAVKFSAYGGWNLPSRTSYCNSATLYQGWRMESGSTTVPFGGGWGAGTVNPLLWNTFEPGDIRQHGSILSLVDDVPGEEDIVAGYVLGGELGDPQHVETGYWSKKSVPTVINTDAGVKGYYFVNYGGTDDKQLWNMNDDILLRYADVLLMAAELGSAQAQTYFDDVRERAGLGRGTKTVSLEAIKEERRHELAFEGLRYHDLLRWGDAEAAFAEASGFEVFTAGEPETYTVTFNPERTFLKIPESQIRLSDGVLEQDPGWQ